MAGRRWTEEETRRVLALYPKLAFGQFHSGNSDVIRVAREIDRTPSSVAMKLGNFASLDPKITASGRKGLDGATKLDREVWDSK